MIKYNRAVPKRTAHFNFLNYFPVEDLEKEGLSNDYEKKDDVIKEKNTLRAKIAGIFSSKR